MLELAILGLLEENDLHGYELRKRLGDLLGLRLAISCSAPSIPPSAGSRRPASSRSSSKPVAATPRSP